MGAQYGIDISLDNEFSRYLDENFYSMVASSYQRVFDRDKQLAGIDTIATFKFQDGSFYENIKIDEKIQSHYIDKNLQTNAFEISFFHQRLDKRVGGWFVDEELETEFYFVIFPFSKEGKGWHRGKINKFRTKNIAQLDILMIDKRKLLNKLNDLGYTKERMISDTKNIVDKNIGGRSKQGHKHFDYCYSESLPEKPVCLLIGKDLLREVADKRFFVYPDIVRAIK